MKKLFPAILFLLLAEFSFSQSGSQEIDSLTNLLKTAKVDTNRVNILNAISNKLWLSAEFDVSLSYANSALALAEKLNFKKGIARAYYNQGYVYWNQGKYPQGLLSHFASLKIGEEINNKQIIADAYGNIGNIYYKQGNYSEAMRVYLLELQTREKMGDKKNMAYAYRHLANVFSAQGNYAEAVKNYLLSLKIDEELNNQLGICYTYCNIGNVYMLKDNWEDALKNYMASLEIARKINNKQSIAVDYINIGDVYTKRGDYSEALNSKLAALKIAEEIGDKHTVAVVYNDIGLIYFKQGKYPGAIQNETASLSMAEEIGDKSLIASSNIYLGEIYTLLSKYEIAKKYLNSSLLLAEEIGSKEQVKNAYADLAKLDSITGNFRGAYQYHLLFTRMKDSLLNEESEKQIAQLKIQYETEKKDKEIDLLNSENKIKTTEVEKDRIIKYTGFLFAGLIIFIAILVFNNTRIKNKAKHLTKANEIRQRISRDLHDEIGAGLTLISMTCEQGKIKRNNNNIDDPLTYDKISSLSRNVSEKLYEVVWATNPDNDNLPSLLSYSRSYVSKFFEDSAIRYSVNMPDEVPNISLKPDVSRNLFFVLKEALNNCVKHSNASIIDILFQLDQEKNFLLQISDNGQGINYNSMPTHRSGFLNMRRRIEDIDGKFEIKSEMGKGTQVKINGNLS